MLHTRTRFTGAALLAALLASGARSDAQEIAPPPRPIPSAKEPEEARGASSIDWRSRWIAVKEGLDVAYTSDSPRAGADELNKAQQRLGTLKEPDPKVVPPVLRARDMDPALKFAQQLAEYHAERLRLLEAVASSTTAPFADACTARVLPGGSKLRKPVLLQRPALCELPLKPAELPRPTRSGTNGQRHRNGSSTLSDEVKSRV